MLKKTFYRFVPLVAALAAMLAVGTAQAAVVQVYNQNNPPDANAPSGGWGSYRGFSVQFDDADLTATGALPTPLLLTEMTIRRSGTTGATQADTYLKVYSSQTPSAATWVGDSTNLGDMRGGISEDNVAYFFDNLELDAETTYYFYCLLSRICGCWLVPAGALIGDITLSGPLPGF